MTIPCECGTGTDDPIAAVNALAEACDIGTRVVALGTVNDVTLYRELRALGVDDYLIKPVTPDQLETALAHTAPRPAPGTTDAEGPAELYLMCGVRGGIGASTVALNVAWVLAHEWDRRVALADLDLQFGTAALSLDLESPRTRWYVGSRQSGDPILETHRWHTPRIRKSVVAEVRSRQAQQSECCNDGSTRRE